MRAVVVVLAGLCLPVMAMAQSVVDCAVLERFASPGDLHENANYAATVRDGRVALILRRTEGYFTSAIDLIPNRRVPGGSFAADLSRGSLSASAGFWSATIQPDNIIMFDELRIIEENSRQSRTRITVFLRCPAPS